MCGLRYRMKIYTFLFLILRTEFSVTDVKLRIVFFVKKRNLFQDIIYIKCIPI